MLALIVGFVSTPTSAEMDETTLVDTDLTKNFTDVSKAKRLRIVRVNEDTATRSDFEVAEQNGLWSIPSKDGYPADAAAQMAEAATSLMDRKILSVESKNASDHEIYGVIDPLSPKLEPGQKGVGTRVTMYDEKKEPLVDLIIGKAVKGAEGQRYVREAGRDIVYVIEIDRSKLSTNFEDWIEKDLLKLNAWDLQQADIKDYSAALVRVMTPEGPSLGIDRDDRAELSFAYNDADGKWTPLKLRKFEKKGESGEYVDFTLAADEELNEESLNALKTALDDLKIVDVVRKPAGLSADLKAGDEFVKNEAAFVDLISKGFTAPNIGEGSQDIISSDGEVVVTTKNGAEYVLRFGNLTNVASGENPEDAAAAAAAAAVGEQKSNDDVHRYMFVMARHNKAAVKQPDLKPLPELPAGAEQPASEAAKAETPAEDAAKAEAPADTTKAEASEDAKAAAPAEDAAKAEPDDAAKAADAAKADDATKAGDETKSDAAPADPAAVDKAKELEKIMAERKRIEQENQRKNDEYQALLKKGEETVKDLNLRFGDWYFVVDDDVFQKIRLGSEDVVKKKAPAKPEGAAPPAGVTNPFPPTGAAPAGLPEVPGTQQ
jgi:hypothetical protein